MSQDKIERYACNVCKGHTKHFIRGEFSKHHEDADGFSDRRMLIVECCGCENLSFADLSRSSGQYELEYDDEIGADAMKWEEVIYPPVTYRNPPRWFEDLPDLTLRAISVEIYKSLQTGSHYLATFGSRTLIDRLIVLTVGDKGNFPKGLQALQDEGKLSPHERDILNPVVDAGNAAAHRGWAPTRDQLAVILDTVEALIHRLLVLPKMAEELEEAVPDRNGHSKAKKEPIVVSAQAKIDAAPKDLRAIYDELHARLKSLGTDVTVHPQKYYMAFRRNRNFASVQVYNQKRILRIYLNVDPDTVAIDPKVMRDVRQIGHYGTGDLEVTIKTKKDIEIALDAIKASYNGS